MVKPLKQNKMTGIVIIVVYALVRLLSDVVSKDNSKPTK
nr:MAG TPA: hypothetical protein [Caudoviricetes sp.]